MRTRLAKIGDVYSVPLPDGRVGYARYLYNHPEYSKLVEIKSLIDDGTSSLADIVSSSRLFPPVFVGLNAAIRGGFWKKIGSAAVDQFEFPTFRKSIKAMFHGGSAQPYDDWQLWDGKEYCHVGFLSPEQASLEVEALWASDLLEWRIASGQSPFDECR